MADRTVVLRLNRQQLELLDRTVASNEAPDREALIRRALRDYAERHLARPPSGQGRGTGRNGAEGR